MTDARLNPRVRIGGNRPPPEPRHNRTCPECGSAFKTAYIAQEFCCNDHKRVFNNRRQQRGAELYDLLMALRFQRKEARGFKVMTLLFRMARDFVRQDQEERAGRPSWRGPAITRMRRPDLQGGATDISPKSRK